MSERDDPILRNDITRNPFIWAAVLVCAGLILAAVGIPYLASIFSFSNPGWSGWVLAVGASLLPLVLGQVIRSIRSRSDAETGGTEI